MKFTIVCFVIVNNYGYNDHWNFCLKINSWCMEIKKENKESNMVLTVKLIVCESLVDQIAVVLQCR